MGVQMLLDTVPHHKLMLSWTESKNLAQKFHSLVTSFTEVHQKTTSKDTLTMGKETLGWWTKFLQQNVNLWLQYTKTLKHKSSYPVGCWMQRYWTLVAETCSIPYFYLQSENEGCRHTQQPRFLITWGNFGNQRTLRVVFGHLSPCICRNGHISTSILKTDITSYSATLVSYKMANFWLKSVDR